MSAYSVSCDGAVADDHGVLFGLAVYTDGEGFNSYVISESDVASKDSPNVRTELLDIKTQLTALWRSKSGSLYVTDSDGRVHTSNGKTWTSTSVSSMALISIWGLSDAEVFAAGDEGIIYRWDGKSWSAIGSSVNGTIFSIYGSAANDIYACGVKGILGHWDGKAWTRIDLPTKQSLTGIAVLKPKNVLVCGRNGTLFRGFATQWKDVSLRDYDFHSVTQFRKTIYLAAGAKGLFSYDGTSLTSVKSNIPFYRLVANDNYLSSASGSIAARFDGASWFGATYS